MRALLLLATIAIPALAQPQPAHDPVCIRQTIVPGFENWAKSRPADVLVPEQSATLTLAPAGSLVFAPPLARPVAAGTFGGTFPLRIASAGRYRIALSTGAWIDVIGGGQRLASADHAHGPGCSGIAKIVAFALQPGTYQVQLSEAKAASIGAMAIADPPLAASAR